MNKYYIEIDKDSIKENDNAGATTSHVYLGEECRFTSIGLPDMFLSDDCIILEIENLNSSKLQKFSGIINYPLYQKIFSDKGLYLDLAKNYKLTLDLKKNYHHINHAPISKYSYKYKNIEIKCGICDKIFKSDDIEEDYEDGYHSYKCPLCGGVDCCDIEYEKLNK